MFSLFPYFVPNLVGFLVIQLLVLFMHSPNYFPLDYVFVVLECPLFSAFLKSCLDMFLFSFLSPVPSDLFIELYCFFTCCVACFSFCPNIFQRFSSVSSFLLLVDFLSAFLAEIPIQNGEHRFYHRLISLPHRLINSLSFLLRCSIRPHEWGTQWESNSLPHRLVRSTMWYCSLRNVFKICYFFQFLF